MPDQVVLIHGTGNPDGIERGLPWWQDGSEFHAALARELSGVALLAAPFRWSGRNSERDRLTAATLLLARVRTYEAAGQPYHLVGHSHGGSVIWTMLKRATAQRLTLSHLRSWTTLGTPFLRFEPVRFSLLRVLPAAITLLALAYNAGSIEPQTLLSPVVVVKSLHAHWSDAWEAGEIALLILVPLLLVVWGAAFLWSAIHSVHLMQGRVGAPLRRRIADQAFMRYASIYLGVWSQIDEAINGLRSSMALSGDLTPRMTGKRATVPGRILAFLQWPFRVVYNRFMARAADEFAWETISLRLQGCDIGGVELVAVRSAPEMCFQGWPALPQELDARLSAMADAHATSTMRTIRESLGMGAVERDKDPNVVANILSRITFQELVHTSYYRRPEIRDVVLSHVAARALRTPPDVPRPGGELSAWYQAGRSGVLAPLDEERAAKPPARSALTAMRFGAVMLLCVAPWFGTSALYRGTLWPFTNEFQIQSIVSEAPRLVPAVYAYLGFYWFRALAASGLEQQALKQAREAPGILVKDAGPVSALIVVASTLRIMGKADAAKTVEDEAISRTLSIKENYERGKAAEKLAVYLAGLGILDQRLMSDEAIMLGREDALTEVAIALGKADRAADAVKLISDDAHPVTQTNAFDSIVDSYLRAGQVAEAVKLAKAQKEPLGHAAGSFMRALVAGGFVTDAQIAAKRAKASSQRDSFSDSLDTFAADKAYAGLALALANAGNLKLAAEAAAEVTTWRYGVAAGGEVSQKLKRGGLTSEAATIARMVVVNIRADDNYWSAAQQLIENAAALRDAGAAIETDRALDELLAECLKKYDINGGDMEVLGRAVESLIKAGDAQRAFRHASSFRSASARGKHLSRASAALENDGFSSQSVAALKLAIVAHDAIVGDEGRSEVCAEIAGALARQREYRAARLRAMSCIASKDRIYAFGLILLESVYERQPDWRARFAEFPVQD